MASEQDIETFYGTDYNDTPATSPVAERPKLESLEPGNLLDRHSIGKPFVQAYAEQLQRAGTFLPAQPTLLQAVMCERKDERQSAKKSEENAIPAAAQLIEKRTCTEVAPVEPVAAVAVKKLKFCTFFVGANERLLVHRVVDQSTHKKRRGGNGEDGSKTAAQLEPQEDASLPEKRKRALNKDENNMESSSGIRTEGPFDPLLLETADKCIEKLTAAACKGLTQQSREYVDYPQLMSNLSMVLMELDGDVKRLIGVKRLIDGARNTPTHSVKSKTDAGAGEEPTSSG